MAGRRMEGSAQHSARRSSAARADVAFHSAGQGPSVAIMCNLEGVQLIALAEQIAEIVGQERGSRLNKSPLALRSAHVTLAPCDLLLARNRIPFTDGTCHRTRRRRAGAGRSPEGTVRRR